MRIPVLVTLALLALWTSPAQGEHVAGSPPALSDLIKQVGQSDLYEISAGKIAAANAEGRIRTYAERMVVEHKAELDDLKGLAAAANIGLPKSVNDKQKKLLDHLRGLKGNEFAKRYVADQIEAHRDAVFFFYEYRTYGQSDAFRLWAAQRLQETRHHLKMAEDLKMDVTAVSCPPGQLFAGLHSADRIAP